MATEKQIAANRQNAKKSTGPGTENGKQRSRRNAFRHGLTAESVVTAFEDEADYRKFERTVIADYAADSAVERGLVCRLASLLWRLRRAVAIESGLFQIQGEIVRDRRLSIDRDDANDPLKVFHDLLKFHQDQTYENVTQDGDVSPRQRSGRHAIDPRELAVCFLRLGNFNNEMLDLVGRYETRLWRQLAQTIVILDSMQRTPSQRRGRYQLGIRPRPFAARDWMDST
jgi:hypothetical protein